MEEDKKDKAAKKSTNAEIELRVQSVIALILQGYSYSDIVRYSANKWNVESRQVDNYIKSSKEQIKASTDVSKDEQVSLAIARYNDLYRKNYITKDFRECRNVQDSLNKMLGLNEADKIDVTDSRTFKIGYGKPEE